MLKFIINSFLGGYSGVLEETTEVFNESSFTMGFPLPMSVRDHCIGKINMTHGVVIGGWR